MATFPISADKVTNQFPISPNKTTPSGFDVGATTPQDQAINEANLAYGKFNPDKVVGPAVVTDTSKVGGQVDKINTGITSIDTSGPQTYNNIPGWQNVQLGPGNTWTSPNGTTFTVNPDGSLSQGTGAGTSQQPAGYPQIPTPPVSGQYTSAQQSQIDLAGQQAGAQYDPLIQQAQHQKEQGMAKAQVSAGEVGGFMNSQFAGVAAAMPTQGGNFIGAGGQLSQVQSAYDLNINQLQIAKQNAIAQAKASMQQFIETGKQQDFQNAQTAYNDAVTAANNAAQLAAQKASTIFDMSQPVGVSTNPALQKWVVDETTKYPGIIAAAGGPDKFSRLNYGGVMDLIKNDPQFKADQLKSSYGTGNYGDYQQAKAAGDFKGTYQQWLAANKQSTTINVSGPGSLTDSRAALTASRMATAVNSVIKTLYPTTASNPINMYANGTQWVNKLQAAYAESTDPSVKEKGPSDLELIDAAVKINNGGQQITETQVNSLLNSMSIPGRASVVGGKITGIGAMLNDGQRKTIKDLAEKTLSGQEKLAKTAVSQINARLTKLGYTSNELLTDPLDAATYMNLANTATTVTIGGQSYQAGQQLSSGNITLTVMADGTLSGSDGNVYDENGNQIN